MSHALRHGAVAAAAIIAAAGCGGSSSWGGLRWTDDLPAWASSGRSIVFASNRGATLAQRNTDSGPWAIYAMDINGHGLHRLTSPGRCHDDDPAPSPKGDEIAFVRDCPSWSTGDLMVVSSNGGRSKRLAARLDVYGPTTELAWSSDGRFIAFPRIRNPIDPTSPDDLWSVAAGTGRGHLVAHGIGGFAWSHHGGKLAFGCHGGSLCVADPRSRAIRRLHQFSTQNDVSSVAWSANDKQLAFVDGSGGSYNPNYSAWVTTSDGNRALRLQRYGEGNVDAVQWLPKHSQVLVINTDDASLYLVHAEGTQKNDLPFEVDDVSPSPDGKNLLFVRRVFDSSGSYYRSAISRANLNTGQTQQLTQRR